MRRLDSAIIALNNLWVRRRKKKLRPHSVLLLLPACLQSSTCEQNLVHNVWNCKRCGACPVRDVLELAERYDVKVFMATGGRLALMEAKKKTVEAVVAVACEKELREGIVAAFPKAVLAVANLRPHGPCKDTSVNVAEVEAALKVFLEDAKKEAKTNE